MQTLGSSSHNYYNNNRPHRADNPKLRQKSQNYTDYTHASKRSYKFKVSSIVQVNPCTIGSKHNHKNCVMFHTDKDRRRVGDFYSRSMCEDIERGQKCANGDQCMYAHSPVQKQYHIESYKKCFCTHWPSSLDKCPYKEYCAYAHSEQQIQAKLIHNYIEDQDFYMFCYKTEFCVLNLTKHQKDKCVYAHNWQDYRRDPSIYSYDPVACYNWKTKETINDYLSGCENGAGCNMCHGWKQLQYHPLSYKTNKCQQKNCRKGECPNYHSQKQMRVIDSSFNNKFFKFAPKNRIVQGLFKDHALKEGFVPLHNHKVQTMIYLNENKMKNEKNDYHSKSVVGMGRKGISPKSQDEKWLDKQPIESDADDDLVESEEEKEKSDADGDSKIQEGVSKLLLD